VVESGGGTVEGRGSSVEPAESQMSIAPGGWHLGYFSRDTVTSQ